MDPAEAVDAIHARFGRHPRRRALHAKGTWCSGTFTATPEAAALSRAAHLRGEPVPVTARLSNGAGNPRLPDGASDVRGLAVAWELPDGSRTDLLAQSVPRFFSPTPEEFIALVRAGTGRSAALKFPAFLAARPKALRSAPANVAALRPIPSYARCRYYAVHAFRWVAADGTVTHVRLEWRPEAGEAHLSPLEARRRSRDYLQEDLSARLSGDGTVRFVLEAQIAAPGDPVDDPSEHWPADRRRIDAGTLVLDAVAADPEADGSPFVFDPMRLTDGIEATDDPVLRYRPDAYSESVARRTAG
jgi:catalase